MHRDTVAGFRSEVLSGKKQTTAAAAGLNRLEGGPSDRTTSLRTDAPVACVLLKTWTVPVRTVRVPDYRLHDPVSCSEGSAQLFEDGLNMIRSHTNGKQLQYIQYEYSTVL
jgi:hypothetical protein